LFQNYYSWKLLSWESSSKSLYKLQKRLFKSVYTLDKKKSLQLQKLILNSNFARFAVILVNLWLGFPYFYLITSGAMQAIPGDLSEAAEIDGASPRQVFTKITLPLLLKIVSPLLVASFAFNFNNFNLIYLLTGGGPRNDLDGEVAGATDILISYTYRIAFGTNVQDLGFASAISVIIFFIVATISLYGIRKSKVLDTFS
jgi:arabinogalactan oligomer/maltooligosaccharide transport system permease protein